MRTTFLAASSLLIAVCGTQAQVPQPSPVLSPGSSNTWNLDWEGVYGRGYFLQHSDDLVHWQYFPLMEMGWGNTIPYGFASSAEKFFVRLRYTDDTNDFYGGDYDGDGVSNWDEIHTYGIDPFNADTDGEGVPDGVEIGSGTDPDDDKSAPDFWWQRTTRDLQYDFDDYEPPNNTGTLVRSALWNASLNSTEQLSAPIPFTDLKGRLQELTFPSTLSPTEGAIGLAVSEGFSNLMPNPPCYHAALNHQRHWLRTGTASPDQYNKTVIIITERTIDGVEQTPEVDTEDVIIPANQLVSEPFDVESGFVQNFTGNEYHSEEVTTTPFTVEIEPDDNQAGTTGDLIPSTKGAVGERHYVSPKKTTEIPDDFVVLKATGVEQGRFVQLLEWEGGEAHPTDPMKRRVKRDAATKTVVKIKVKQDGAEAAKMNVWVVWSQVDSTVAEDYQFLPSGNPTDRWSYSSSQLKENYWRFRFTIQPATIITAADRPKLDGANDTKPPGHGSTHHQLNQYPADHASNRWDTGRQLEVTVINPNLIPKANFPALPEYANQPKAQDVPVPFPNDPVEGNDDPGGAGLLDEDSNPYAAFQDPTRPNLAHQIGQISCSDRPEIAFLNSMGVQGSTLAIVANFKEFARLNLIPKGTNGADGEGWYRISDHTLWHYVMAATYGEHSAGSGIFRWVDSGSVSTTGRFDIPEEP